MSVLICPGVHKPELTQSFLAGLGEPLSDYLVVPTDRYPPYSTFHILDFLRHQFSNPIQKNQSLYGFVNIPLVFVSFSAGVVGSIGTAWAWQGMGGEVKAFIAVDGWGVPLQGNFPIHRVSHDSFTHRSSLLLGGRDESFYADPPLSHLELWRSPQAAQGWRMQQTSSCLKTEAYSGEVMSGAATRTWMTAAQFLLDLLTRYQEVGDRQTSACPATSSVILDCS